MLYSFEALSLSTSEAFPAFEELVHPNEPAANLLAGLPKRCLNAPVLPTVSKLSDTLEQIRQHEIGRFHHKKIGDAEARLLEEATKGTMSRFLALVSSKLEAACQRGESEQLVEMLTQVFRLDSQPTPSS
jgi:glutamyl-tRNA reductase